MPRERLLKCIETYRGNGLDVALSSKQSAALQKIALLYPSQDEPTLQTLLMFDKEKINCKSMEKLVIHIDETYSNIEGAMLIFLLGLQEIQKLYDELMSNSTISRRRRSIIQPLDSSFSTQSQQDVYCKPFVALARWSLQQILLRRPLPLKILYL